jgi:hypothetical protein
LLLLHVPNRPLQNMHSSASPPDLCDQSLFLFWGMTESAAELNLTTAQLPSDKSDNPTVRSRGSLPILQSIYTLANLPMSIRLAAMELPGSSSRIVVP